MSMDRRYSPAELKILARLARDEARARERDREAEAIGLGPMFIRGGRVPPDDGIDLEDLEHRLREHAKDLEHDRQH